MEGSLFGRLPAELRNEVYYYLLPPPNTIHVNLYRTQGQYQTTRSVPQSDLLPLALTCKSVYGESIGMHDQPPLYHVSITPFHISFQSTVTYPPTIRRRGMEELHAWLEDRGDALQHVSDVHLFVAGNLSFINQSSTTRAGIEPATMCLATAVQKARSVLVNTALTIHVRFPVDGHCDYNDVPVQVGNLEPTNKLLDDEASAASTRVHEAASEGAAKGSAWSPAKLAKELALETRRVDAMRWFVRKTAA